MKKYIIALLLSFCYTIYSQAQPVSNLYRTKVDSLQSLINYQQRVDTTTVKRLNYLARFCFFDMQFKRGMIATIEARQLAKKLNYAKGEGMYYRTLSYFNNYNALPFYYNYMSIWSYSDRKQKENDPPVDVPISDNFYNQKAKPGLEEAIAYFEKHPNGEILANLVYSYSTILKPEDQAPYVEKVIRLFEENKQTVPHFIIKGEKMVTLERAGKLNEAKKVEIEVRTMMDNAQNNREAYLMKYFLSRVYSTLDRVALRFKLLYQLEQELEEIGENELRSRVLTVLAEHCLALSLNKKAIEYYKKEATFCESDLTNNAARLTYIYHQIAFAYISMKDFEQAKIFIEKARNAPVAGQNENTRIFNTARYYDAMGQILMAQGKYDEALKNFSQALTYANKTQEAQWLGAYMNFYSAQCYQKLGQVQESIKQAKISYDRVASINRTPNGRNITSRASLLLSELYEEAGESLEAYKYLKVYQKIKKETDLKEEANHMQDAEIRTVIEKEEHNRQLQNYRISLLNMDVDNQRKIRTVLLGGLGVFALLLAVLFRQNRAKQRFNQTLARQKEQIEQQRDQLDQTLTDLKSTQAQLIQKEKLASLGELTAGIAHEIQNPLNFVNNFSELSVDLIEELKEERKKESGKRDEGLEDEILGDIEQNLGKINHHGNRASSIVKGMLEHSKTSSGKKELTDINALVEEYLKLAHHGMKAKDKNFQSEYKSDLDNNLPKVEVQPQDIGRVLLNLINNAFYAVSKVQRAEGKGLVTVTTQQLRDKVEVRIKDNGTGIPENIKAKIFQPFFTTKPTGEGTGLGLSLAYDIVTKGHGGTLEVESVEGEGAEFIITLPII